jgi:hypothetical protein
MKRWSEAGSQKLFWQCLLPSIRYVLEVELTEEITCTQQTTSITIFPLRNGSAGLRCQPGAVQTYSCCPPSPYEQLEYRSRDKPAKKALVVEPIL